jgi:hypothetical protein
MSCTIVRWKVLLKTTTFWRLAQDRMAMQGQGERPDEPRRSPPRGNDPSPHGSFDLKRRAHREGGSHQFCQGKIEFWIFLWSVYYGLLGVGVAVGAGPRIPARQSHRP